MASDSAASRSTQSRLPMAIRLRFRKKSSLACRSGRCGARRPEPDRGGWSSLPESYRLPGDRAIGSERTLQPAGLSRSPRGAIASQAKEKRMAKTVLIVEDNELNMKLFQYLLETHGYATLGSRTVHSAIDPA